MVVRWQTFEQYHNKKDIGSTRIRVHNLNKFWPESGLYRYGEKADVMIFQKVYCTYDYKLPAHYPGVRILDTCDPDWLQTPDIYIKETLDNVHAAVVPTESMRDYLQGMTDTPVRIIKDRFVIEDFPKPKVHNGELKTAVWFGYAHNAELLQSAIPSLEKRGISLIVIANDDPMLYRYANDSVAYQEKYQYIKFNQDTLYTDIQKADICIMPKGYRHEDRWKSENKTVIAQLCGLPVCQTAEQIDKLIQAEDRQKHIDPIYDIVKVEYDCRKSVQEYKDLIDEINRTISRQD